MRKKEGLSLHNIQTRRNKDRSKDIPSENERVIDYNGNTKRNSVEYRKARLPKRQLAPEVLLKKKCGMHDNISNTIDRS